MDRRKIAVILAGSVLVVIVIVAIIINALNPTEDPKQAYLKSAVQTTIDKDTGAQIINDPNLGGQSEEARAVIVLGMEEIIRTGALSEQTDLIKDSINVFSDTRLKNKYSTITIRPQGLVTSDGVTTTTIRLGQSDEILPIIITAKNTGETQIIIEDPSNKYGGRFDSELTVFGAD